MAAICPGSVFGQTEKPDTKPKEEKKAAAKDPFAAPKQAEAQKREDRDIVIMVEFLELDLKKARMLIREHVSNGNQDQNTLYEEVEKLIAAGQATPLETMWMRTRSGQRARVDSVEEIIYAKEFDPPRLPNKVELDSVGEIERLQGRPALPAAFETREAGSILEVDPVAAGDGSGWIDLNLSPELVHFRGMRPAIADGYRSGEEETTVLPDFHTMKLWTQTTLRSGNYHLLGLLKPDGKREHRVMVFVRADLAD